MSIFGNIYRKSNSSIQVCQTTLQGYSLIDLSALSYLQKDDPKKSGKHRLLATAIYNECGASVVDLHYELFNSDKRSAPNCSRIEQIKQSMIDLINLRKRLTIEEAL